MSELHLPWLELSVLLPLAGAIVLVFVRDAAKAQKICVTVCLITLVCALCEWFDFASLKTFERTIIGTCST